MRRVERQFLSMAVVMLLLVGVVLAANTVIIYSITSFYHNVEMYFHCLQVRLSSSAVFVFLPSQQLLLAGALQLAYFSSDLSFC